jgi:hypothetical protein
MRQALARVFEAHPIIWYTLARVALLLIVMVPLALAGLRGLWLLVAAFLVSGAMSLFLLDGLRAGFSGRMSGYFTRLNRRIDESARAEDVDDEDPVASPDPAASAAPAALAEQDEQGEQGARQLPPQPAGPSTGQGQSKA